MRVAAEVLEHVVDAPKRLLRVHHPLLAREPRHQALERFRIREVFEAHEGAFRVQPAQRCQHLAAKQDTHHLDGEQIILAARLPARPVRSEAARGDQPVHER